MKLISIVTPTYNEEENVRDLYEQTKKVFEGLPAYRYEHIFIDNASKDATVTILKEIAAQDPNVKIIVNSRNFGQIRSPMHGLLQASGDAVALLLADLQDPPAMIADFIGKWEQGFKVVLGVKIGSQESWLLFRVRRFYYALLYMISGTELTKNNAGFGLYDRAFMNVLREMKDPYPYFRGQIAEIGFERAEIPYHQPQRKRGLTKNNFFTLFDFALQGITSYSKIPLRIATILGMIFSALGLLIALGYLIGKLVFWNNFPTGIAPLVIGGFTFLSLQLFFIGMLGEYIAAIHTQVLRRPLVVERERINFDTSSPPA
ncbi:glycosyltransferase family 2 protein [Candidatus Peregrinibacteria bacterium]|nr:glycosyltransferase family 2 protein [Candidatus Peregrinibacteria bacterium]